ncbi:MAG: CPBP family intramembrane metalloprotease [Gemmataceae bacterium]|nr:CPBP family intramembrane metalloprotease [Gemmataceae bacterium]
MPVPDPSDPPLVTLIGPSVSRRPRPGLWEAGIFTVVYAVVVFGSMFALAGGAVVAALVFGGPNALQVPEGDDGPLLPPALGNVLGPAIVLAYIAGAAFTLYMMRTVIGWGWAREVGLDRLPPAHVALALALFPAFTVGSDLLAGAVTHLFGADPFQADAERTLADLLGRFHWSFAVLAVGICPGVAEELWCRGFLGRGLVGRYGPWLGVLFTSMFFGLLHIYPPAYVLITAVMGAVLHFTYLMSRSLWVPILLHVLNNSLAALGAVGMLPGSVAAGVQNPTAVLVALTAGGLIASGLAMWAARDPSRRKLAVVAGLIGVTSSGLLVRELWP